MQDITKKAYLTKGEFTWLYHHLQIPVAWTFTSLFQQTWKFLTSSRWYNLPCIYGGPILSPSCNLGRLQCKLLLRQGLSPDIMSDVQYGDTGDEATGTGCFKPPNRAQNKTPPCCWDCVAASHPEQISQCHGQSRDLRGSWNPSKIALAEFPGNGDKQQLFSFHIRVVSQNEERGSKIP